MKELDHSHEWCSRIFLANFHPALGKLICPFRTEVFKPSKDFGELLCGPLGNAEEVSHWRENRLLESGSSSISPSCVHTFY